MLPGFAFVCLLLQLSILRSISGSNHHLCIQILKLLGYSLSMIQQFCLQHACRISSLKSLAATFLSVLLPTEASCCAAKGPDNIFVSLLPVWNLLKLDSISKPSYPYTRYICLYALLYTLTSLYTFKIYFYMIFFCQLLLKTRNSGAGEHFLSRKDCLGLQNSAIELCMQPLLSNIPASRLQEMKLLNEEKRWSDSFNDLRGYPVLGNFTAMQTEVEFIFFHIINFTVSDICEFPILCPSFFALNCTSSSPRCLPHPSVLAVPMLSLSKAHCEF